MTDADSGAPDASTSVVEAVAERLGRDSLELNPRLADVIDPDALDALLGPRPDGSVPPVTVTFEFHGHSVTVDARDGVDVRPSDV